MSILQFIVNMQWSLLLLVLMVVGVVWVRRMRPETRLLLRGALMARGIKATVGSVSLEVGAPASPETVAKAAASDEQLTKELEPSEAESAEEQVQQLRRDAVEQVIREAAKWGWGMARAGIPSPPSPQITWNGDKPEFSYPLSPMEHTLLQMAADQNARIPSGWLRPHAGQDGDRGGTGGRGRS